MTLTHRRESDLVQALLELERHVNEAGWDQPHRLFALADAAELRKLEPQLLPDPGQSPGELVAIEQALETAGTNPVELLAQLAWPDSVVGAALTVERVMVPTTAEPEPEADAGQDVDSMEALADHPERAEVRLAVAVTRDGMRMCALRFRDHDDDDQVLTGADLVDPLSSALLATFD